MASDARIPAASAPGSAERTVTAGRAGIGPAVFKLLPLASAIVSRLSVFVTLIVAARLLSPERFGAFAVLSSVAAVVVAIVIGGGDMWLNRFSRRPGRAYVAPFIWPHYAVIVLAFAALVVLAAAAVGFGTPWMPDYGTALVLAVAGAAVAGVTEAMLALYRASGRTGPFFAVRDLGAPTLILLLLVLLRPHTETSVFAIILSVWAAMCVLALALLLLDPEMLRPRPRLRLTALWRTLKHTGALIYGNLGSRLSIYIDVFALTFAVSLAVIGTYRVAAQFAIGFIVAQHYVFLGLPWQLSHIGTRRHPGSGHAAVIWRQRLLVGAAFAALVLFFFGGRVLLGLFGPHFLSILPVLQALLLLRFGELLWGPQHEILISNGHVIQDAHVNVASIAVWIAVFLIGCRAMTPVHAAVTAAACASISTQALRRFILTKAQLRTGAGHGFGPAIPIALALLAPVIALTGT